MTLFSISRHPITRAGSWFLVVAMMLSFAGATVWIAAPERARVIQVLFPFPLTILGSWFLTLMALNIGRLLFTRRFDIVACAIFALIAVPISWSGWLEEIPGLARLSPQLSPTLIQALPIPILMAMQVFLPRSRSVDRLLFAGLGAVVAGIHILFHVALTIPEAEISRHRQVEILELMAQQPPEVLTQSAIRHGGVALDAVLIRNPAAARPLPADWGEGAEVVFANLRRLLDDAPATTFISVEPGNTIFERIGYLYDGRPLNQSEPRVFLFPSTATNQSLMNAQRAHFTLGAIGSAFWFLTALALSQFHARVRRRAQGASRLP